MVGPPGAEYPIPDRALQDESMPQIEPGGGTRLALSPPNPAFQSRPARCGRRTVHPAEEANDAGPGRADGTYVDLTVAAGNFSAQRNTLDETLSGLGTVTAKHGSSPAFGGRIDIWFNDHFALQGSGFLAGGSSLEGQAFGVPGSVDASLFYGTGRAVAGIGGRVRLLLSAGFGFRSANYDTPDIEDGSLTVGVVGAGLLVPLGTSVALRLDADDYVYDMYWEVDGLRSREQRQHDVMLTVGLTFRTGG